MHTNASTHHVVTQHQSVTFLSLSVFFKTCGARVHETAELVSFGCRSRWADVRRFEPLGGSCWPEVNLDLIKLERWVKILINAQALKPKPRKLESKKCVLFFVCLFFGNNLRIWDIHSLNGWLLQYLSIFTVLAIIRWKTKGYNQQETSAINLNG